ncbi:hypothetical protein TrCOL_g3990 [Triparma columacea]|uniref:Uncharacterized protein n=1 Tax=Triparma columacea TaxID=722753 RepID=A0A9W7GPZ6_9STRA|nr:hypothetical protein TrCOL_g3990 [Triparma columacea]
MDSHFDNVDETDAALFQGLPQVERLIKKEIKNEPGTTNSSRSRAQGTGKGKDKDKDDKDDEDDDEVQEEDKKREKRNIVEAYHEVTSEDIGSWSREKCWLQCKAWNQRSTVGSVKKLRNRLRVSLRNWKKKQEKVPKIANLRTSKKSSTSRAPFDIQKLLQRPNFHSVPGSELGCDDTWTCAVNKERRPERRTTRERHYLQSPSGRRFRSKRKAAEYFEMISRQNTPQVERLIKKEIKNEPGTTNSTTVAENKKRKNPES